MRHDELYVADLIDSTRAVRGYLDGVSRAPGHAGLPEAGQPGQQLVASHQSRLPGPGSFRTGTRGVWADDVGVVAGLPPVRASVRCLP
jgi:hypothetical protein